MEVLKLEKMVAARVLSLSLQDTVFAGRTYTLISAKKGGE